MASIYNLRTYCPECGVVIKPDNIRRHLINSHNEVPEEKIAEYEYFIQKCIESNVGERLSIDLSDFYVTLLDRPFKPIICRGYRKQISKTASTMTIKNGVNNKVTVTRTVVKDKKVSIPKNQGRTGKAITTKYEQFSLIDKLECPFCRGMGGLESSHGCFYCGG